MKSTGQGSNPAAGASPHTSPSSPQPPSGSELPSRGKASSGWRSWGPLTTIAIFFVSLLLLLTVSRLGLAAWQLERVTAVDGLFSVLLNGLRMDVLVLSMWVAPAVLGTLVFSGQHALGRLWSKALLVWLVLGAWYFLLAEAITPGFIAEFDTRPNRLAIEYLNRPQEVVPMLLKGFLSQVIAGTVVATLALLLAWRGFSRALRAAPYLRWKPRLVAVVLLPPLLFLGIRSSLGHRPANPSSVVFASDHLVNQLCLSSGYSLYYAVYRMKDEADASGIYGSMPRDEILAEVRAQMKTVEPADFTDPELPTLHRQVASVRRERPKNLVILLEESLGAQYVGELGGRGLTPHLDRLADQGWWFDRMYATGTRSARGIEAVVTGFLPTPARAVLKLGLAQGGFFTLANLLGDKGYRTQFFYGGEAHFDNMSGFLTGNGFAEVIDRDDIADPVYVGSWGASDEDMFRKAHETLEANGDDPFCALIFSVSNHTPWEFPKGRIGVVGEETATEDNSVRYADYAIGEFIRLAKDSSYWEDTIFVVVADHDSRVFGADRVPVERFHIPAVILGADVPAQRDARITSQIDLGPTLLSLMGIDSEHPMVGRDLTRLAADDPGRAILQYGESFGYLTEDQIVVLRPGLEPEHLTWREGLYGPVETPDADFIRTARAHALLPSWLYAERRYRLPETEVAQVE